MKLPRSSRRGGGDPHCGSALSFAAKVGTYHANRSWPGGLALCCLAGNFCLCHISCRRRPVIWTSLDSRHAVSLAVRCIIRILDLLPAPRAGAAHDQFTKCYDHYGGTNACYACCPGSAAKATQPGHRYHSAQPGHRCDAGCTGSSTSGSCDPTGSTGSGARSPRTVGLQATARMMFSHDLTDIVGRRAA
jgi:hypothetical protein